eukprot:5397589-Alexandrium_andersonii.AAC.1
MVAMHARSRVERRQIIVDHMILHPVHEVLDHDQLLGHVGPKDGGGADHADGGVGDHDPHAAVLVHASHILFVTGPFVDDPVHVVERHEAAHDASIPIHACDLVPMHPCCPDALQVCGRAIQL